MKKISIITVCYNALKELEATIHCVKNQTYNNVDYVVIDGGSTDGTKEYLVENSSRLNQIFERFVYVSEQDKGIYDAMNKGTSLAEGEYLLFLNAGDVLENDHVLNDIVPKLNDTDFLYGDTIFLRNGEKEYSKSRPINVLDTFSGMPFCHQSVFINRNVMMQYRYSSKYYICADLDFILRAYRDGKQFKYVPILISIFEKSEGVSSKYPYRVRKEIVRINYSNGVIGFSKFIWMYFKALSHELIDPLIKT